MLTITKRPCKIGGHMNARTEKHGDEDVPALDIALDGIMLTAEELNALLEDPTAHRALFQSQNGKLTEPTFAKFKPFVLKDSYDDATVTIIVGLRNDEITLHGCKLRRITLEPQTGGMTKLSLSVGARPELEEIPTLFDYMNHDADVEIADAKVATKGRKQGELALSTDGDAEPEDEPDDEAEPEELPEAATA